MRLKFLFSANREREKESISTAFFPNKTLAEVWLCAFLIITVFYKSICRIPFTSLPIQMLVICMPCYLHPYIFKSFGFVFTSKYNRQKATIISIIQLPYPRFASNIHSTHYTEHHHRLPAKRWWKFIILLVEQYRRDCGLC